MTSRRRRGTTAALIGVLAAVSGTGRAELPDRPFPVIETGAAMMPNLHGRFEWLDADTLAITTFGDEAARFPWMLHKVLAYDVRNRQSRTLIAKGSLGCVNQAAHIVSALVGDLRANYESGFDAPKPVQTMYRWDGARLVELAPQERARWNPWICQQTLPEDLNNPDPSSRNPGARRYLQPGDGHLAWDWSQEHHKEPIVLYLGTRPVTLAATNGEMSMETPFLPFLGAYQLSLGRVYVGTSHEWTAPVTLMRPGGAIERMAGPVGLQAAFKQQGRQVDAPSFPVRQGLLTVVGSRIADGGGFYLTRGGQSQRIWCTAPKAGEGEMPGWEACTVRSSLEISPDGCKVAFDARWPFTQATLAAGLEGTVKIIDLCQPPA